MIRLLVFGAPQLAGPEAISEDVLVQPKRFALLAYLLLARPHGPQYRDALLGLFWPESEPKRARDSLRQALSSLRQSLGPEVLISHGRTSVEIAEARLWCDAREFECRLDSGEEEAALELYRGDLLDGFHFTGTSAEFNHWLDQERARLKRRASEAARALTERCEAEGDHGGAIRWARREAELDPFSEDSLRSLLERLTRSGDFAGAITEYDRFAQHLESVHEYAPSGRTRALVEQARSLAERSATENAHAAGVEVNLDRAQEAPRTGAPPLPGASFDADGSAGPETVPRVARGRRRSALAWIAAVALPLLFVAIALSAWEEGEGSSAASSDAVAVFPFRTGGADPALGYLHEGMVDLLSSRLSGGVMPQAVHPAAVLRVWDRSGADRARSPSRDALAMAVKLGAGGAVLGQVVGTPERLHLSASLLSAPDGRIIAEASAAGPADSLATLVDALVMELVLRRAGIPEHRLASSPHTPLPALRAYLQGESDYRAGRHAEAARSHQEALAIDPTFVPAALGALSALRWTGDSEAIHRVAASMLRMRDRLAPSDEALLDALISSHYPLPRSQTDQIAAWGRLTATQPTNAEAWYWYGDHLHHWGRALGLPSARDEARRAFERSIQLDSAFMAPVIHLAELLLSAGETEEARRIYRLYTRENPSGELRHLFDWFLAAWEQGSDPQVRERLDSLGPGHQSSLVGMAQLYGIASSDAERAIERLHRDAELHGTQPVVYARLYHAALNRGRPSEVREIAGRIQTYDPVQISHLQMPVMAKLYSDGDSADAARAARQLAEIGARAGSRSVPSMQDHAALCTSEQWKLRHGDTGTAQRSIGILEMEPVEAGRPLALHLRRGCALYLSALLEIARGKPEGAIPLLERLSGELRTSAYGWWEMPHLSNLLLAEAYESTGRPKLALEVLRRRPNHSQHGIGYLSTFLLREARLATQLGDTAGAVRAYKHYLALRHLPEPSVAPEVRAARREHAILSRRGGYQPLRAPRR